MLTKIQGGRVIDPGNMDAVADILVEDDKIVEINPGVQEQFIKQKEQPRKSEIRIIDASGKIVCPGFIDMHVHLREPGHEHKETIMSGTHAACYGGFTAVCAMPNTRPVNDSCRTTEFILSRAAQSGRARVYPVGAISKGLEGRSLCNFEALKACGVIAVSDDGNPVMDDRLMHAALEAAKQCGLPVISHCEDINLAQNGVMNAGKVAAQLGLSGIPNTSESAMVERDIALSEQTGASIHIAHVSTAESVQAIREAKSRGVAVTAETAPHYFMLTDTAVRKYGTHAKMNPPLRSNRDRAEIKKGLADGTIDAIATDHAPHSTREKTIDFEKAANGIIGLESAVSLGLKLVEEGMLSLAEFIAKMSTAPAGILGLESGLQPGRAADITVVDPEVMVTIDVDKFQSLSRNCPFDGWQLKGGPVLTMVAGKIVYQDGF